MGKRSDIHFSHVAASRFTAAVPRSPKR
jgi:hypothetical protein